MRVEPRAVGDRGRPGRSVAPPAWRCHPEVDVFTLADRTDAGRRLAAALAPLELDDPVVLALPRGGVPVAAAVADALGAPLDVLVVRKIGAPRNPEFAVGAVGEGGAEHLETDTLGRLGLTRDDLTDAIAAEQEELRRRVARYRHGRAMVAVRGRTVVLVDDGIATGASARVAAQVLRRLRPARIVLAVPVAPDGVRERFADVVDELVVLATPAGFTAVGAHYRDFDQTSDEEVARLLAAAAAR